MVEVAGGTVKYKTTRPGRQTRVAGKVKVMGRLEVKAMATTKLEKQVADLLKTMAVMTAEVAVKMRWPTGLTTESQNVDEARHEGGHWVSLDCEVGSRVGWRDPPAKGGCQRTSTITSATGSFVCVCVLGSSVSHRVVCV